MLVNKAKFSIILFLSLTFFANKFVDNSLVGNPKLIDLLLTDLINESQEVQDNQEYIIPNYLKDIFHYNNSNNCYNYQYCQYGYVIQKIGQCVGVILLVSILLAFWWLIVPTNYSNDNRHKKMS